MQTDLPQSPPQSTLALQFGRFRANRLAMAGVVVLVLIVLACYIGPLAFPFMGEDADFDVISLPVDFRSVHLFGTDNYGRDLLVRTLEGGQVSLAIGFLGAPVAGVIGVAYGATAGFLGGRTDSLMMRAVEVLYGFPYVILVILLSLLFAGGTLALFAGLMFQTHQAQIGRKMTPRICKGQVYSRTCSTCAKPSVTRSDRLEDGRSFFHCWQSPLSALCCTDGFWGRMQ